jgi:hypothetical protein
MNEYSTNMQRIFFGYGAEVLTSGRAVGEIQPCISLLMTFLESLITNDSNEDVPVPKKATYVNPLPSNLGSERGGILPQEGFL